MSERRIPGFVPETSKPLLEAQKNVDTGNKPFGATFVWGTSLMNEASKRKHYNATAKEFRDFAQKNIYTRQALAERLIPDALLSKVTTLSTLAAFPKEPEAFRIAVTDALHDKTLSLDAYGEFFTARTQWMMEHLAEMKNEAQEFFDAHRQPLVDFLGDEIYLNDHEKQLLLQRLDRVNTIAALDPLLANIHEIGGDWNNDARTLRVNVGPDYKAIVIHEMLHALSATAFWLEEYADDDDMTDHTPHSARVGTHILDRFHFLNEGITELLTARYFHNYAPGDSRPPLPERAALERATEQVYANEQLLLRFMHAPWMHDAVADDPAMDAALENAQDAGVTIDEFDFDQLLFRAYLLDNVSEDGKGRAEHWRAWSAKMREYYGDGILPELDNTWKTTDNPEHSLKACCTLLTQRFIAKWAPQE